MNQELMNRWITVAHQIARHRWPVVHVPLPPQRKIGENPEASTSLYWPGKGGREGVEYVLERGPKGQHHYWIGNALVEKYADRLAVANAIAECETALATISHLTALAQKDKEYQTLSDIVNALVLAGRVHHENIADLGEFKPLVAVCYEMRQIAGRDWHGSRVRNLVEGLMDGRVFCTEVTVIRENGRLAQVKAQIYRGLCIVFYFWGHEWTSLADCWFGVRYDNELELQAIGETYRDQTWHISHICELPGEALTLLDILTAVKRILGWEE